MDEGRISTAVRCLLLVAIVIITAPQKVQSHPCGSGSGAQIDTISQRATNQRDPTVNSRALALVSSTPSAIKKDLFMSRGWGASGMPFSMFYLNHYTKAQKAYVQSQLQQQQMQRRQLQQQDQLQQHLPTESLTTKFNTKASTVGSQEEAAVTHSDDFPIPNQLPYGTRFADPVTTVPEASVQAEKLRSDNDYVDNGSAIWHGSNTNVSRRQYTVPQLFVSYGWGPMG
uniref:Putative secreted protein n=1 Tax=Anopheles marajoara TaxID=58244 RepID=A0A2M4BYQ5_9DIPT